MDIPARRIVSLLPGATEWVCGLGLHDRLVGVSHECDFPSEVVSLPKVTRGRIDPTASMAEIDATVRAHSQTRTPLYDLDVETLVQLEPELILTQSLCNVCAVSQRDVMAGLSRLGDRCRLVDLRATTMEEVFDEAFTIAKAAGEEESFREAIESLQSRVEQIRRRPSTPRPTVTLLEWLDPMFCAGHWTPQLIDWAGGRDPIGRGGQPSRQILPAELFAADPDILLVACCGLDVESANAELAKIDLSQLRCFQSKQVHVFDGSAYFNRPGPRLVDSLERVGAAIDQWRKETDRVPLSS